MGINYKDEKYQGKYVYPPLMGETAVFDIVEINEVKSDNAKFNFSEKVPVTANGEHVVDDDGEPVYKTKDLGYHIEAKLKNGKILSVTSMATFISVFKKYEIQDGDKVRIFHKDKGEWEVTKLTLDVKKETEEMNARATEIADDLETSKNLMELEEKSSKYKDEISSKMSKSYQQWLKDKYESVKESLTKEV